MWDPLDFDGLVAIGLLNNKIWLPDIRLYNRLEVEYIYIYIFVSCFHGMTNVY